MTILRPVYPTGRAVLLTAAGAPVALLVGVALPSAWTVALGWLVAVVALIAADALLAPALDARSVMLSAPASMPVGGEATLVAMLEAPGLMRAEMAIDVDERLTLGRAPHCAVAVSGNARTALWPIRAARRGTARIASVWLRWRGPLGLVWRQQRQAEDREVLILPDLRPVREQAPLLLRRAAAGEQMREIRGLGTEFHALVAFADGMDKRWIDWKQSARHASLLARDWRIEQNHQIVFAIDSGRAMVEPVDGVPRIDRAVTASLVAAYVALELGDRAGLYAYAERPLVFSGIFGRSEGLSALQRHAAAIDYLTSETNHVLGLTHIAQRLNRRSIIVVFTEFADPTAAEHLLRAAAVLLARHVLLFVIGRTPELDDAIYGEPRTAEDVTRAVAAAAQARERALVIARLRRLGARVIVTTPGDAGSALIDAYLLLKRQGLA